MGKKIQAPPDLPTYDKLIGPSIQALKKLGGSASTQELLGMVVEMMNVSEETQSFRREGQPRPEILKRLDWTRWFMRKAGVVDYQDKLWTLLPKGRTLTEEEIKAIPADVRIKWGKKTNQKATPADSKSGSAPEDIDSPSEDEAGNEIGQEAWRDELLNILQTMDSAAFERLTQLILRKSGFAHVEVTGRTNDQGIDGKGVLRLDLISFHVLFQCKRYKETVGSPELRDFRGAMAGRTDKGLFLTTGRFTPGAIKEATREGAAPIELIDGEMLCDLLKKLKIGTDTEIIQTEKVSVSKQFFESI